MLRISRMTDYATVLLARMATDPLHRYTASQLAGLTRVAVPTVSKLLKQLQRAQLVQSTRGLHGGYRLARSPDAITAADVLDAMEGPVALTECSHSDHHCGIAGTCGVGRAWQRVNLVVRRSLGAITLLELAGLNAQPVRFAALERSQRNPRGVAGA